MTGYHGTRLKAAEARVAELEAALQAVKDDRLEDSLGLTIERATIRSRLRMREIAAAALAGKDSQ